MKCNALYVLELLLYLIAFHRLKARPRAPRQPYTASKMFLNALTSIIKQSLKAPWLSHW
jgi:hypothetical protein